MKLKNYQELAVDKLLTLSKKLLQKEGTRICVLKAPTGSGKTIMVADWLEKLASERLENNYSFIWISGNNLHKQSKEKLEKYLSESRYTLSYLEDIQEGKFKENEIAFVNWHSLTKQDKKTGKFNNIFMRENESDRNLHSFVDKTKVEGREIILIVDESHYHYWSIKSQELVQSVIHPKFILEVSATPSISPSAEDLANEDAGYVSVKFDDVVAEGMIKKEVVVNPEIGKYTNYLSEADDVILNASIMKLRGLQALYNENNIPVKPLLLIQLPSDSSDMSALDETKLEHIKKYLEEKEDITIENGKLAIWLSKEKYNTEGIEESDNKVEVLIFKQAIALGWDCPRAQILVMFREIKSKVFEVQTVGRILRTPEAKHYSVIDLDRAYVFTNLERIIINQDKDSTVLFQVHVSHRKPEYETLKLPSIYLKRVDYGDLTLAFRRLFFEEANKYFGITEKDMPNVAVEKADQKLELEIEELKKSLISDAVFSDIDSHLKEEIIGSKIDFTVAEDEIKSKYEDFAKLASLPYAPVRSHNKIQVAIYDWFEKYLGLQGSKLDVQRIVVCSENNQKIFEEIIDRAKEIFQSLRTAEINSTNRLKKYEWDVPIVEYFNENYELKEASKYILDKCYLDSNRPETEKKFEELLEKSNKVLWWYKNGVNKEIYFAVSYLDPNTSIQRAFYPDYIIKFQDGSIGIYDTKSGFTAESEETKVKSNTLQEFIKGVSTSSSVIKGGIVQMTNTGFYIFEGFDYVSFSLDSKWKRLDF
ncbi:MAG: DEAD/DEAH box helicase family protein [Candidatus Dojkabacteria bacterium]